MKRQLDLESAWVMLDSHELVPARLTTYGMAVDLDGDFIQCGRKALNYASLSIRSEVGHVRWFARFDFVGIAELIIAAHERCRSDLSRESIFQAVRAVDLEHDSSEFDEWCRQRELEVPQTKVPDLRGMIEDG